MGKSSKAMETFHKSHIQHYCTCQRKIVGSRISVPIILSKLHQPANQPLAAPSSLEKKLGLFFSGQCSNAGCESTRAITRVFFRYRPPYNSCHICSKVFEHNVSQSIKNIGLDLSTLAKQKCLRSIQWKNKYIDNVILNPHIYWLLMSWRHAFPTLIEKLHRSQYWDKVNLNID